MPSTTTNAAATTATDSTTTNDAAELSRTVPDSAPDDVRSHAARSDGDAHAHPRPAPPEPVEEPSETASPASASEGPDADESGHTTQEKRRWALAALVLLIGGSAALRALGRG